MNLQAWFEDRIEQHKEDPGFLAHQLLIRVTEEIARLMDAKGITRTELAQRLGVKPPLVTRILQGQPNITILTLVRLAVALDVGIGIEFGTTSWEHAEDSNKTWERSHWIPQATTAEELGANVYNFPSAA